MDPALDPDAILTTIRELRDRVSTPLWLFGGVGVDFLVGKWTRPHGDMDFNTFSDTRGSLAKELCELGYRTSDGGWLTHWLQVSTGRRIEIVFLDRGEDGTPILNIPAGSSIGIPGRYRLLPGYMDVDRFATLEGICFRVCSPEGEWLGRSQSVVAGRTPEPKIGHDRSLLEGMISPLEIARLRLHITQTKTYSERPVSQQPTQDAG